MTQTRAVEIATSYLREHGWLYDHYEVSVTKGETGEWKVLISAHGQVLVIVSNDGSVVETSHGAITQTRAVEIAASYLRERGWLYDRYEVSVTKEETGEWGVFISTPAPPYRQVKVIVSNDGSVVETSHGAITQTRAVEIATSYLRKRGGQRDYEVSVTKVESGWEVYLEARPAFPEGYLWVIVSNDGSVVKVRAGLTIDDAAD